MKILYVSRSDLYQSPGGDTVQLDNTRKAVLAQSEQDKISSIDIVSFSDFDDYTSYDLIHVFNLMLPYDALNFLKKSKFKSTALFVLSPIYVDYSRFELENRLKFAKEILSRFKDKHFVEKIKFITKTILGKRDFVDIEFYFKSFSESVSCLISKFDLLLPNSNSEMNRIIADFNTYQKPYVVIDNAVDCALFSMPAEPYSSRSGVVIAGRIEQRKNQLNVIRALNKAGLPALIVGSPALNQKGYYKECVAAAGKNITFTGQLSQKELADVFTKSKVSVLASWFETTGLVSIEAAASGCNLVITNLGDTVEYFGDEAFYCDPANVDSIQIAIESAYEAEYRCQLLSDNISSRYSWEHVGRNTYNSYISIFDGRY